MKRLSAILFVLLLTVPYLQASLSYFSDSTYSITLDEEHKEKEAKKEKKEGKELFAVSFISFSKSADTTPLVHASPDQRLPKPLLSRHTPPPDSRC